MPPFPLPFTRLTSGPVLRAAYASMLGTQSQDGKGGTARSLMCIELKRG